MVDIALLVWLSQLKKITTRGWFKLKLTKEKAIDIAIDLWTYLAETGGDEVSKAEWLTNNGYLDFDCDCSLCEYDVLYGNGTCHNCPLWQRFTYCSSLSSFSRWLRAKTADARKKYAKRFLVIIKELKEK